MNIKQKKYQKHTMIYTAKNQNFPVFLRREIIELDEKHTMIYTVKNQNFPVFLRREIIELDDELEAEPIAHGSPNSSSEA